MKNYEKQLIANKQLETRGEQTEKKEMAKTERSQRRLTPIAVINKPSGERVLTRQRKVIL